MGQYVHVCDAITGQRVESLPWSAYSGERLLSARGGGSVTMVLDGSFTRAQLRALLEPGRYILAIERDGKCEFGGYITGRSRQLGDGTVTVPLQDFWWKLSRMILTEVGVTNVALWSKTVTAPLAEHARQVVVWAWNRNVLPSPKFPVNALQPGVGPDVTRTYYGYSMQYVADVLNTLMDEGVDVYFEPRFVDGVFTWTMHNGLAWMSGKTHELFRNDLVGFTEVVDGTRVTNNADRVGEGSEINLLVRSSENAGSHLPLLERITMSKHISDPAQLGALAHQDLITYGQPTVQRSFTVLADTNIDVGDTVRVYFEDDAFEEDGPQLHRVVKMTVDEGQRTTVTMQSTGGA